MKFSRKPIKMIKMTMGDTEATRTRVSSDHGVYG